MTLAFWPQPAMWRVRLDRGPWWTHGFRALRLGPFELHLWEPSPLTPEERYDRRARRAVRLLAACVLIGCLVGMAGAWRA